MECSTESNVKIFSIVSIDQVNILYSDLRCNSTLISTFRIHLNHFMCFLISQLSIFSRFSQTTLSRISYCVFHFTASFIRGATADSGFYTFARDPYETCRGHRDEKVEKRVQVAKIYGETENTWTWSRLIVFLHRLRHIYFIARETDGVLISLWHTTDDR